jgi:hypothetical protein
MLTARVDIIGHTTDTVDVQVIVFPTESTDPEIGSVDVLDNSVPPISLIGGLGQIPDCAPSFGVDTPFRIPGIPLTRLPIQVRATVCMTGEMRNLGTFLQEMSPRTGAVPCGTGIVLPPSQQCIDAQNEVSTARAAFLRECSNIADARGRRDSAIVAAGATGAAGIAAAAGAAAVAAAIYAAIIQAAATAAAAGVAAASVPVGGWIVAAALALVAVALLIAAAVFLANFLSAQSDLDAANRRQVQNLQAFHDAVDHVRVACCEQQVSPSLNRETPTCP